jgi:hypothetical protein
MARNKKKKSTSESDAVTLPLRVACVDMGSNAIRFLAAEFGEEQPIEVEDV